MLFFLFRPKIWMFDAIVNNSILTTGTLTPLSESTHYSLEGFRAQWFHFEMLAALFEGQKVSVGSSTFNTNGQKFCIYISYSY